jgi:predicted N-acyltransferase
MPASASPTAAPPPSGAAVTVRHDRPLEAIPAADWNALAGAGGEMQPFLDHAFLAALHATGCAVAGTGWRPRYLTAWQGDELVGAMPLYAKAHSYGEYILLCYLAQVTN